LLNEHLASTDEGNDPVNLFPEKQVHSEDCSPKAKALILALKVGFLTGLSVLFIVTDKTTNSLRNTFLIFAS
jgi:hypothetical protein